MNLHDTFEHEFSFTQDDVNRFAEVTGDNNPIHLDEEVGKASFFKQRILHGFLSGSVFSKVLGTLWPGNGTIYLSQNMAFKQPMFPNQKYTAVFEVTEVLPHHNYVISTNILDANKTITIEGEAHIKYNNK